MKTHQANPEDKMLLTVMQSIALLLLLILLPYYLMFMTRRARLAASIPGPKPLPFLGNALEFGRNGVELLENLHRLRRKYGYFARFWLGPHLYVVVADPQHAEIFLTSSTNITKSMNYKFLRPWVGLGLATSTGEKWRTHRKLVNPAFSVKNLEAFLSSFNLHANNMVRDMKKEVGGSEFDVYNYLTLCTLDIVYETIIGVPMDVEDRRNKTYLKALEIMEDTVVKRSMRPWLFPDLIFNLSEVGKQQKSCVKVLHDISNKAITLRKNEFLLKEKEDEEDNQNELSQRKRIVLLDVLLESQRDGVNLTDKEIREEIDTFIFVGHETVAGSTTFCLWLLSNHPQCQEKAYDELQRIFGDSDRESTIQDLQEMKYLETVIKESMRLYPSGSYMFRELDEEVKLDGCRLLPGTTVAISPLFIHRHPDYFPEPEKFDPDRFSLERSRGRNPFAFIPFSAGPRNCIGQKYAMLEMKCIISAVLRNFKLLPGVTELTLSVGITLRSVSGVHIMLENRK